MFYRFRTWGTASTTPSIACRRCTRKSLRSLKAFTIVTTSSPPALPRANAATPAFWEMLLAPEVDWNNMSLVRKQKGTIANWLFTPDLTSCWWTWLLSRILMNANDMKQGPEWELRRTVATELIIKRDILIDQNTKFNCMIQLHPIQKD